MEVTDKAMPGEFHELVDRQLETIIPAVRTAAEQRCRIALFSLWQRIPTRSPEPWRTVELHGGLTAEVHGGNGSATRWSRLRCRVVTAELPGGLFHRLPP